jgi:phosphoribosyl 1,2-cyclic phosphodiesterase
MDIKIIASGSKGNCLLVDDGASPLLLECGVPLQKIRRGILPLSFSDIKICLITHTHRDHSMSMSTVLSMGIPVYMPRHTAESYGVENDIDAVIVKPGDVLQDHGWTIWVIKGIHDVPCMIYAGKSDKTGETFLFMADTAYVENKIANVNYLITECNFDKKTMDEKIGSGNTNWSLAKRIMQTHLGLENLITMIERNETWRNSLKGIFIFHLSDINANWQHCVNKIQESTGIPVYCPK